MVMRSVLYFLVFSCFCSCVPKSQSVNIETEVVYDKKVPSDLKSVYNDSTLTVKSKGGVYLESKELMIVENDTSYYLKINNCEGMYDLSNGNFYMMLNDSCYHYIPDSLNVQFFSSGGLDTNDKLIWVREVDTTYSICVSESDSSWSVFEDMDSGERAYEYISSNVLVK